LSVAAAILGRRATAGVIAERVRSCWDCTVRLVVRLWASVGTSVENERARWTMGLAQLTGELVSASDPRIDSIYSTTFFAKKYKHFCC
jgi:hypothetical protein